MGVDLAELGLHKLMCLWCVVLWLFSHNKSSMDGVGYHVTRSRPKNQLKTPPSMNITLSRWKSRTKMRNHQIWPGTGEHDGSKQRHHLERIRLHRQRISTQIDRPYSSILVRQKSPIVVDRIPRRTNHFRLAGQKRSEAPMMSV